MVFKCFFFLYLRYSEISVLSTKSLCSYITIESSISLEFCVYYLSLKLNFSVRYCQIPPELNTAFDPNDSYLIKPVFTGS